MNLGLVGNYSCANRGDAAILRGLIETVEASGFTAKLFSEQPDVGEFILGRQFHLTPLGGIKLNKLRSTLLQHAGTISSLRRVALSQTSIRQAEASLQHVDALVFVGGSYFLDEYGLDKYRLPLLAHALGIPFALCGHSLGPFDRRDVQRLAQRALRSARAVVLRDETSVVHATRVGLNDVAIYADTAWLAQIPSTDDTIVNLPNSAIEDNATVAVTLRRLAPFDQRLGVSQERYERMMANCLDTLIARGLKIVAVAMCTGLGGYHMDDRMAAVRVRRLLRCPERMVVVMDELTDIQLCVLLRRCLALIGTRMHSTILAMHAGTPALAIPYEHKSIGLFEKMGFAHRILDVKDLRSAEIEARLQPILDNPAAERTATITAAHRERTQARDGVCLCLNRLGIYSSRRFLKAQPTAGISLS